MDVYVLLYNVGKDEEGIHSIDIKGRTIVLMFEEKDDAQRMCGGGSNNLKNLGFVINRSERIEVRHN